MPWLVFSPTNPHADAGMRMLPPPSDALANGTIPAATAAAEPPLEPPGVRSRSHGLCVAPHASGWVVGRLPSSGLFVRPAMTSPAARYLATSVVSCVVDDARFLQRAVAVGQRLAGVARVEVLEQERHAAERPVRQLTGGDLPGVVEPRDRQRVQLRIGRLHPLDRRLQQLDAA